MAAKLHIDDGIAVIQDAINQVLRGDVVIVEAAGGGFGPDRLASVARRLDAIPAIGVCPGQQVFAGADERRHRAATKDQIALRTIDLQAGARRAGQRRVERPAAMKCPDRAVFHLIERPDVVFRAHGDVLRFGQVEHRVPIVGVMRVGRSREEFVVFLFGHDPAIGDGDGRRARHGLAGP